MSGLDHAALDTAAGVLRPGEADVVAPGSVKPRRPLLILTWVGRSRLQMSHPCCGLWTLRATDKRHSCHQAKHLGRQLSLLCRTGLCHSDPCRVLDLHRSSTGLVRHLLALSRYLCQWWASSGTESRGEFCLCRIGSELVVS